MTTGEMLGFTNRFKEIMASKASDHLKDMRLSAMMTDMECAYRIPMLRKPEFEAANPFVMQMYRTASEARAL